MKQFNINHLDSSEANFEQQLKRLSQVSFTCDNQLKRQVADIIEQVCRNGDQSLLQYNAQFDHFEAQSVNQLEITPDRWQQALGQLTAEQQQALSFAAKRIREFHQKQTLTSWQYEQEGILLGQRITPLQRVGIYVPGGQAPLASSVLMSAIPATIAGVQEIIMLSPTPKGIVSDWVLAAAHLAGVTEMYSIGGAQAIAALAFGTETIKRVDKIVGPGNSYVTEAKRQVYGYVGIDMIAGPSEIVIICDGDTPIDWIVLDLFSQAEHDPLSQAILISPDTKFLAQVQSRIPELLATQPRAHIIAESLHKRGALITVQNLTEAIAIANQLAPEHLELSIADPQAFLPLVQQAGAIFMGRHTPEAFGDYCLGPNHILPTSGTARFASPVGVYDFIKRTSIMKCDPNQINTVAKSAAILATGEQLPAHAMAAQCRHQPTSD